MVPYVIDITDLTPSGTVVATARLDDAYAHIGTNDLQPVSAESPISLEVQICDDGVFCNGEEVCVEDATDGIRIGLCQDGPDPICSDGLFCNGLEYCDPVLDSCQPGEAPICDDGLFCNGLEYCDEDADSCADGTAPICDDGLFCNGLEYCDEDADSCADGTPPDCAALGDECNDGVCDEDMDMCKQVPLPPDVAPPECFPSFICRTPGFWGTHAAYPKNDGFNGLSIVEDILAWGGPLMVCGKTLDTSFVLGHPADDTPSPSTTEAICVSPKGAQELQLARQMTALALNCRISGGMLEPGEGENLCTGTIVDELYAECDAACQGDASAYTVQECIHMVDCINNGGDIDPQTGMCTGTDGYDNCHSRDLCPDGADFCYEPPGPASSPKDCNAATKNDIYIFEADVNGRN